MGTHKRRGIQPQTQMYIDYIQRVAGKIPQKEIAKNLGISVSYVGNLACNHNINIKLPDEVKEEKEINSKTRPCTKDDVEFNDVELIAFCAPWRKAS